MVASWMYDLMYRVGAPWEAGPRDELVGLVTTGRLRPGELPRSIDLGCGSGANAIFLARRGFDVTGVDFSPIALRKARAKAATAGTGGRVRFVRGDLTASSIPGVAGTFDLLVDYGTLDDLKGPGRAAMAATIGRLSHPGSRFLLWCFYARRSDLPVISFKGASRLAPALEPGEEQRLFGDDFDIERLPEPEVRSGFACFLMSRR